MHDVIHDAFEFALGEDLTLRGDVTVLPVGGPKPVVIYLHGFKGFKDWGFGPYTAEQLAKNGFAVIRFNFTRNGVAATDFDELHKFGGNTYAREQADLAELLDRLLAGELPFAEELDRTRIALIGHSRGGGNAIIFAAEHPEIRAVVTWNGIAHVNLFTPDFEQEVRANGIGYVPNARTKQQMPILPAFFDDVHNNAERFDIVKGIAGLQIPAMTIQGDQDSERLVRGHEQLRAAAPQQEHVTIDGANHTFGAVHPFTGSTPELEQALHHTIDFLRGALS
ncbi:pimeloyl-ACP methyl ester carboxylesterase [Paenibacillus phyllosphaerae]|uniref:Pimeloyl-ACP methyl ester carboxylesterase n=1 Tax=Paenibacillus phyllosphaerae TaxID=274593 RepID=A0A7W5AYQ9_9BACL|nr:alpha/beta fold hydrolase [Paenibacillus phyllosphaerae]MBB3111228.1 pimeloyl-ACP methyl ester carboxylesterase [Paenibacillus phyllosphaerae]